MPYHKIFHISLFVAMFLHLVSSPTATAIHEGHLDYSTTSVHKVTYEKNGKNDLRSAGTVAATRLADDYLSHRTAAYEQFFQPSLEHSYPLAIIKKTRLTL
jgi:hypothetical protein